MTEIMTLVIASALWLAVIFCTLPVALRVPWLGRKIALGWVWMRMKEEDFNEELRVRNRG